MNSSQNNPHGVNGQDRKINNGRNKNKRFQNSRTNQNRSRGRGRGGRDAEKPSEASYFVNIQDGEKLCEEKYEVIQGLASGTFGRVYELKNEEKTQRFAGKIMEKEVT
jgi:hypothetical protein